MEYSKPWSMKKKLSFCLLCGCLAVIILLSSCAGAASSAVPPTPTPTPTPVPLPVVISRSVTDPNAPRNIVIVIISALTGSIGGFSTGYVLKKRRLFTHRKQEITIIAGWAVGFTLPAIGFFVFYNQIGQAIIIAAFASLIGIIVGTTIMFRQVNEALKMH